jgi:ribosomal protein S18 acetylase RimI-like enzyme
LLKAQAHDLPTVASIFEENMEAVLSQGPAQSESLASDLLHHENLPPNGEASREHTFLVIDKVSNEAMGLLSVYRGYPTKETLYVGSLYFRQFWQRRGLGREVIEKLEGRATEEGYQVISLVVGLKNWPALRFWVSLGFDRIVGIFGDNKSGKAAYANVELTKNLNGIVKPSHVANLATNARIDRRSKT